MLTFLSSTHCTRNGAIDLTTFYNNYVRLCAKKGKSASGVAREIGLSNAAASGWKNGKEPSDVTLQKLSSYFGVPVSELSEEEGKAPIQQDRRLGEEEMKAAFFGGYSDELTKDELDELWDDAKDYLRYKIEQKKKRRE